MEREHIEECPVCRQKQNSQKFFCEDYFVSHEKFAIYSCDTCQFVFTQDIPSKEVIAHYYEAPDYISHSDTKKGLINLAYHLVRKKMILRKIKLVEKNHTIGRLLDVGCGTGYFAGAMKQKGWEVTGIEPSVSAAELARNKFGLDVMPSHKLLELPEKKYDIITLWHVLEHLGNLNASMAQFSRVLKNDGVIIIAVPNVDSYDANKYKEYWAAFDVPRHIWHFSPETFNHLARNHGFEIIKIKPMPFDAFYISMLSEKYKKSKIPAVKGFIIGFASYFICLFNKKKSSSLIYMLKSIN